MPRRCANAASVIIRWLHRLMSSVWMPARCANAASVTTTREGHAVEDGRAGHIEAVVKVGRGGTRRGGGEGGRRGARSDGGRGHRGKFYCCWFDPRSTISSLLAYLASPLTGNKPSGGMGVSAAPCARALTCDKRYAMRSNNAHSTHEYAKLPSQLASLRSSVTRNTPSPRPA